MPRPEHGDALILIGEGEYQEVVNITRSGPVTLLVRMSYFILHVTRSSYSRVALGSTQLGRAREVIR